MDMVYVDILYLSIFTAVKLISNFDIGGFSTKFVL